jgi:DNA polymerase-3 subunit gamma/tau
MNCACEKLGDDKIVLSLSPLQEHLLRPGRLDNIEQAIRLITNKATLVTLDVEESDRETPADCLARLGYEQLEQTKESFKSDPGVKAFINEFGATLNEESIKPA